MSHSQLFIDRYKPRDLDKIGFCEDSNNRLKSLATSHSVPHIIIKGNRGSAKKTRALLYLKEMFGDGVFNINSYVMDINLANKNKDIALHVHYSPYHYQFNPSLHGVHDRSVLQEFIDQIVKTKIINNKIPFRVIVLEDTDLLTHEAQQSLRRTLETRIKNCRFIFLVNRVGHLIAPIYSRCSIINVALPTEKEITGILNNIVVHEKAQVNDTQIKEIVEHSERNLSRALNSLQKLIVIGNITVDYEYHITNQIVDELIKGSDLNIMSNVRNYINELTTRNFTGTEILGLIFKQALKQLPKSEANLIYNVCCYASEYDNSLRLGGKVIYHIEAFCLKLYKEIKIVMIERAAAKKKCLQRA